jgi:hypothetical protein
VADAAPAGRPSSSFRWAVVGCGGALLLGLLGVGVATIVLYVVHKKASEIADVGAEYLRQELHVRQAVGSLNSIDRRLLGWKLSVSNGVGHAYFAYGLQGTESNGEAEVWLERPSGRPWEVSGVDLHLNPFHPARSPGRVRLGNPGPSRFEN